MWKVEYSLKLSNCHLKLVLEWDILTGVFQQLSLVQLQFIRNCLAVTSLVFSIPVISTICLFPWMLSLALWFLWISRFLNICLSLWGWNAKVENQEIPGVTGKFGLGVENEAGQSLIEFCQEMHLSGQTLSSNNTRLYTRTSPDVQYQNQIDYIFCSQIFAAKDEEAVYSQQK